MYSNRGELDKALSYQQQALEIHRRIGEPSGEAEDLANIGNVYRRKGALYDSQTALEAAIAIYSRIGGRDPNEVDRLQNALREVKKELTTRES